MRSRQKDAGMSESGAALLRSRYLLAGWSFAAVLFGIVGVSAVRFSPTPDIERNARAYAGLPLPATGAEGVGPTGSIVADDETVSMGLMPSAGGMANAEAMRLMEAQVDTLRRELVALRRRAEMLSEQNRAQSERLAALEKAALPAQADEARVPKPGSPKPAEPQASTQSIPAAAARTATVPQPRPAPVETIPAPETSAQAQPMASRAPEAVRSNPEAMTAEVVPQVRAPAAPVRIVQLPKATPDEPNIATGSIPTTEVAPPAITRDLAEAMVIRPADPAGRTLGSSAMIGRSDFAIEIGRYANRAEADAAWIGFRDAHKDRMADLRALTAPVEGADGIRLLAGPFANAALAAVACLRLSEDGTSACRPTFFVGEPLDDL